MPDQTAAETPEQRDGRIEEAIDRAGRDLLSWRLATELDESPLLTEQWSAVLHAGIDELSKQDLVRAVVLLLWDSPKWTAEAEQAIGDLRSVTT